MSLLAAGAVFVSAVLLFTVQLVLGKLVLAWFGGCAAVWATSMVFYQALLLAGYFYSDQLARRTSPRVQAVVHVALLLVSLVALPVIPGAHWKPAPGDDPQGRILLLLAATVGLPYLALSATSPLVSAWLARSVRGSRPYTLYAFSNAGSVLGLLGYPLLVEPNLPTSLQARVWSWLFVAFAIACTVLAFVARRAPVAATAAGVSDPPRTTERIAWVALAFCPSALMLAVTNHLTQNVAAVPLLWVLPLTAYLLSFVLCFAAGGRAYRRAIVLPVVPILVVVMIWSTGLPGDAVREGVLFLAGLFFVAVACHGELGRRAPAPAHLTKFYLAVALGGVLGSAAIGFAAPAVLPARFDLPATLAVSVLVLALAVDDAVRRRVSGADSVHWRALSAIVAAGIIAALFVQVRTVVGTVRSTARNFYGSLTVYDVGIPGDPNELRVLVHGVVSHGEQYVHASRRREPTAYYGPETGVGRAMLGWNTSRPRRVGVVGLGTGTLAAYTRRGDEMRFYELNPLVVDYARREFTFLDDARGDVSVVLGDGRLVLESEPPRGFDLLVADAFSGDAVPVHLLTREAFELYHRHLAPDGLLAVNVTNRFLDLALVVARAAQAAGGTARSFVSSGVEGDTSRHRSHWILVTWAAGTASPAWPKLGAPLAAQGRPWTDDYSELLGVLR